VEAAGVPQSQNCRRDAVSRWWPVKRRCWMLDAWMAGCWVVVGGGCPTPVRCVGAVRSSARRCAEQTEQTERQE
jgi:hypothetical protein